MLARFKNKTYGVALIEFGLVASLVSVASLVAFATFA